MPVFEEAATSQSACVSTAPVFALPAQHRDGAPKSRDVGWWTVGVHNARRPPGARSSWWITALWAAWLAALLATACVPVPRHWYWFVTAIVVLAVIPIWFPDPGDTVLPYYSVVFIPIVVFQSAAMGGLWAYSVFLLIFGLIPVLDCLVGVDVGNQTQAMQRELHKARRFEVLTLLIAPLVLASIWAGAWLANSGRLTALEVVGLSLGVGVITGSIGIVAGHELCHKASRLERLSGRLLLCAACYGHFYVEHTLGHHKWVSTHLDPATSRFGENFYAFLPRVMVGEFCSAWRLEMARLRKRNLGIMHSELPLYFLMSAILALAMMASIGPSALPFFLVQSVVAVLLFEGVNYLEHYGLERVEVSPGVYEAVQPQHSWDSPARITNHILFRLQRHADHHANAGKRYQTLQAYDTSPQLPSGYATMILLAFIPPLWRAVMHPRVLAHRRRLVEQDTGRRFQYGPTPQVASSKDK